jgi:hypothetical protein
MYALGSGVIAFEKVMDLECSQVNNKLLYAQRDFRLFMFGGEDCKNGKLIRNVGWSPE